MLNSSSGFRMSIVWLLGTAFALAAVFSAVYLTTRETPSPRELLEPLTKSPAEMTEEEQKAFVEKLLMEKGLFDPRGWHFPKTAFEYAKIAEPELGVPPKIDLSESVEIPLHVQRRAEVRQPRPLLRQLQHAGQGHGVWIGPPTV